jgi:GTP cyclohydrolase IB
MISIALVCVGEPDSGSSKLEEKFSKKGYNQVQMLDKSQTSHSHLPDVAAEKAESLSTRLDWVGMTGIEIPVRIVTQQGESIFVPARASAFVSLDQPEARGIHMSRLFKLTQDRVASKVLSMPLLKNILADFLLSHQDLSKSAKVAFEFQAPVERKALKSENRGWRTYPVKISAEHRADGTEVFRLQVQVTYSSTCPASAALSRQLIQANFNSHFKQTQVESKPIDFQQVYDWLGTPAGINATPHAQRSFAEVEVELAAGSEIHFAELIDLLEEALQTPVQAVVKREDEQEFALRNGQNLMFCEDAARRIYKVLSDNPDFLHFSGEVRHVESLHPHDAVSRFSR